MQKISFYFYILGIILLSYYMIKEVNSRLPKDFSQESIPNIVNALGKDTNTEICAREELIKRGHCAAFYLISVPYSEDEQIIITLWKMGHQLPPEVIPHLIKILGSPYSDFYIRWLSAATLGKMLSKGSSCILPHLISGLLNPDVYTRKEVLNILSKVNEEDIDILTSGLVYILSNEENISNEAIEAGKNFSSVIVPELIKLLDNPDNLISQKIKTVLYQIDPNWEKFKIHQNITTNNTLTNSNITQSTAAEEQQIHLLIKNLESSNSKIRRKAAQDLGNIAAQDLENVAQFVPKLIKTLNDQDWLVRESTIEALGKIGPEAIPSEYFLLKALVDQCWRIRVVSKEALNKINPNWKKSTLIPTVMPEFLKALKDQNWEVQEAALDILDCIGQPH